MVNATDVDQFSEVGLAEGQSVRHIAEALCDVGSGDYLNGLEAKLNRALVTGLSSKMPAPSVVFYGDRGLDALGLFETQSWLIKLNSTLVSEDSVIDLLLVLAHEVRHAEQRYLAAKYHAKIGHSRDYIQSILFVPTHVAQHAVKEVGTLTSDEFQFGKYFSNAYMDKELYKKKKDLLDLLKEDTKSDRNAARRGQLIDELPAERDAFSFNRIMRGPIEDCLLR